ncbi:MAG: hypothetical protein WBO23_07130 [Burkholderiales bacterium]
MAPVSRFLGAALVAALLFGCSSDRLARGVYEGSKARNDSLKGTPREKSKNELPSYDQYEKERNAPAR